MRGGNTGRRDSGRRLALDLGPKILASPAYKAGGLLVVAFGWFNPIPSPDLAQPPTPPASLKTGALLLSPFVTPARPTQSRYDPYSWLATNGAYSASIGSKRRAPRRSKSLAPQLLAEGENGGG